MPIYENEEELKRRNRNKAPADAYEKAMSRTPAILRPIIRGGTEAYKYGKKAFGEAAARPTQAGKIGRGLRAAVTTPAAALYGAAEGPVKSSKRIASGIASGVGELATEFMGGDSTATPSPQPTVPTARAAAAPSPPPTVPTARAIAPSGQGQTAINLRDKYGDKSGVAGSGYITSQSGSVRMGPDGRAIMIGTPVGDSMMAAPMAGGDPGRQRSSRMATYGGYRLPQRAAQDVAPASLRISDIEKPKTIGGVPVYRRKVEAAMADIAAEQKEKDLAQRQRQFEAGQGQQQQQFEAGQGQQQQQFETRQGLEARRLAGTEQQQQLAAERQATQLAAEGRKEAAAAKSQADIAAARRRFDEADTPGEKLKAMQMLNSLQGMKIDAPTMGRPNRLSKKEVSEQVQGALKIFQDAGGEANTGEDFHSWMQKNDPTGYEAAFGSLTPNDIKLYNDVQSMSDEELKSSSIASMMRAGESVAQFKKRLTEENNRKRGY